ncbi:uncharacterized protein LOC135494246 [Lineus longissimus]|uniref:uncharacterized protein LOC135494246 n=1 Tax=Lineus longissimus TaxID=88925 RepID=UPI002B4EEAD0
MIRPQIPLEGEPKPPDTPGNPRVGQQLKAAGQAVNIDFTGKSDIRPNTALSHVLMDFTLQKYGAERQNDLAESLFKAYFTDGTQLNKADLLDLAREMNLDVAAADQAMSDQAMFEEIYKKDEEWKKKGVSGVPYFLMNGKPTFSGAQDVSAFLATFEKV